MVATAAVRPSPGKQFTWIHFLEKRMVAGRAAGKARGGMKYLTTETRGDVAIIGLNFPEKRSAMSDALTEELELAGNYTGSLLV
ncbi:MAG: hypothetical protein HKN42_10300 [Granulosicoccus sp.]|nr:hypothetical protein [Granulosicoccus sp.]